MVLLFRARGYYSLHISRWKNILKIGPDYSKREVFQTVVPKRTIFGSTVEGENCHSLVGCAVALGFDFADFKLHSSEGLLGKYPDHNLIINRLTW